MANCSYSNFSKINSNTNNTIKTGWLFIKAYNNLFPVTQFIHSWFFYFVLHNPVWYNWANSSAILMQFRFLWIILFIATNTVSLMSFIRYEIHDAPESIFSLGSAYPRCSRNSLYRTLDVILKLQSHLIETENFINKISNLLLFPIGRMPPMSTI